MSMGLYLAAPNSDNSRKRKIIKTVALRLLQDCHMERRPVPVIVISPDGGSLLAESFTRSVSARCVRMYYVCVNSRTNRRTARPRMRPCKSLSTTHLPTFASSFPLFGASKDVARLVVAEHKRKCLARS